jgi:polyribonucleotide nucleotidyltransferase
MGKRIPISQSFHLPDGREVIIETGQLASQADGSVVIRCGNTMLFCAVVSAKEAREGAAFFPLSVDYQEKFAAGGRIPGSFHRREGQLSTHEILTSRLVDRAIRPLFPDHYMNDTQVIINLISGDANVLPDALAALAASSAIMVSDIPWDGPISEVRVAKINGEYHVNPNKDLLADASLNVIVGATIKDVTMVEGEAKECSEAELIEAIKIGHEAIKVQCEAQKELAQKVGGKALQKREVELPVVHEELNAFIDSKVAAGILEVASSALEKGERKDRFKELSSSLEALVTEQYGAEYWDEHAGYVSDYFDKIKKEIIRKMVLDTGNRLDGRRGDEIRDIWAIADFLPAAHGSAVFTRGETQALTSLTLGTKTDELMQDTALGLSFEKFLLHYNFPGFCVGEVKPQRGPSRREIGHANLAARSLKQVMPDESLYTTRLVTDILESNGSSSMATVCSGSLALMDGGIQIKNHISGIAMGMISDGKRFAILSDILGDEDALGDMDFKVTGTENGICGCQMDIKIDGMPYEMLEKALDQAKAGRLHIIDRMKEALDGPREDVKPHAPRMVELIVDKSFIGPIIGPGGKVIQEMQAETGTVINIEEVDNKGIVTIASSNKESIDAAVRRIREIAFVPVVGDVYDAKVASLQPYGVFVDFAGKSGLLHISEISHSRIDKVEEVLQVGDSVKVKLIGIDPRTGKLRLSRKALMEKPSYKNESDQ